MLRKAVQVTCKSSFTNSPLLEPLKVCFPYHYQYIHTTEVQLRTDSKGRRFDKMKSRLDNLGQTATSKAELQELGLAKYAKKHRQYAQFSFEDYKTPIGPSGFSISCTNEMVHKTIGEDTSTTSLKERYKEKLTNEIREVLSNREIKRQVKDFHKKRFPIEAHEIYVEAHNLLNTNNWTIVNKKNTIDRLHELVTEHAYPVMVKGLENKTIIWKLVESIEAPRVVKLARVPLLEMENLYAQVTVRFHTKQILAVYDRFGRLMHGSPDSPRNVLEHVCFERHIVDDFGRWRIHGKLPTDTYPKEPLRRTVAAMKTDPIIHEAKDWEKEEIKVEPFLYYPEREEMIEERIREDNINKDEEYWRKFNKARALKRMSYGLRRMSGKARKLTELKMKNIKKMREEGKLPLPPKDQQKDD